MVQDVINPNGTYPDENPVGDPTRQLAGKIIANEIANATGIRRITKRLATSAASSALNGGQLINFGELPQGLGTPASAEGTPADAFEVTQ